jgi:hypothetical protein
LLARSMLHAPHGSCPDRSSRRASCGTQLPTRTAPAGAAGPACAGACAPCSPLGGWERLCQEALQAIRLDQLLQDGHLQVEGGGRGERGMGELGAYRDGPAACA